MAPEPVATLWLTVTKEVNARYCHREDPIETDRVLLDSGINASLHARRR